MAPLFAAIFLIFLGIECLVGIAVNTFIAAVNLASWTKGITLTATDEILIFLGLSNLCLQGTAATAGFSYFFCAQLLSVGFSSQVFCFFLLYSTFSSFVLTALLFASYCVKILNLSQWPVFLWMKVKFIKRIHWIVLWYLIIIFGFSMVAACNDSTDYTTNYTANHTGSYSKPPLVFHRNHHFRMALFLIDCTWPVCVTCLYVVRLLRDIWKHIWSVKKTMSGTEEPNLDPYRGATKTLISLLILHLFYYMSWSVILLDLLPYSSIEFLICITTLSILATAKAVTIILGTSKHKKKALETFQKFKLFTTEGNGQTGSDVSYVTAPM